MDNDFLKNKKEREHLRGKAAIDKKNREIAKEERLKQQAINENKKMQQEVTVRKQLSKIAKASSIKLSKRHQKILLNFSSRKNIAHIYSNYTKQQGIDYKQTFTSRYKSINYSGNKTGKNSLTALKTSLNHSSRKQKRTIEEWLDSESHMNIYYADDNYYSHTDFVKERDKILRFYDDIKLTVNDHDDQEHKQALARASKNRNSYAAKLKKLLPSSHRAEHQQLKNSISNRKVTNKNSTLINESVFKIPHSMGDLSHLPKQELLEAGISFFKQHFPQNTVQLGCLIRSKFPYIYKSLK